MGTAIIVFFTPPIGFLFYLFAKGAAEDFKAKRYDAAGGCALVCWVLIGLWTAIAFGMAPLANEQFAP